MDMRALNALLVFLPAMLAATPPGAQVYKWVDERGVINYSNQLPANPEAANRLGIVEDRVSVYTPDQALLQAIEAERRGGGTSARIAELERQLDAERRARHVAAAAAASRPSDPCSMKGIDCSILPGTYYTPAVVAARPRFFRPRPVRPVRPEPALIATLPDPSGARPLLGVAPPPRSRPPRPGHWDWPR